MSKRVTKKNTKAASSRANKAADKILDKKASKSADSKSVNSARSAKLKAVLDHIVKAASSASASRKVSITRATKETQIELSLDLDGSGRVEVDTGIGFFDHMLDHIGRHGLFDLSVRAKGDLQVDDHHTVEDVGICLGEAIARAIGNKKGIRRYGFFVVPMEESLAQVAVDLSGRAATVYRVDYQGPKIGRFDVQLVEEFLRAVALNAKMNLHVAVPYGTNDHHIAEAICKALGKALRMATERDPREVSVPSTKGVL